MQKDSESRTPSKKIPEKSGYGNDISAGVFEEMQSVLAPWRVGPQYLAGVLQEAHDEIRQKMRRDPETAEHLRLSLQGLILWKIFARKSALWIDARTDAGNEVALELMVAAYSMWKAAERLANKHRVDTAAAAGVLARATHTTVDQIAQTREGPVENQVRDIRKYIFASYKYSILEIAEIQGTHKTEYVDMADWIANRETDHGAFMAAIEDGILCGELLKVMPRKCKTAAVARHILGYSWQETADAMGTTVNTAQKELSLGIRKAVGACVHEIRKMGHRKLAHIESHLAKTRERLSRKGKVRNEN